MAILSNKKCPKCGTKLLLRTDIGFENTYWCGECCRIYPNDQYLEHEDITNQLLKGKIVRVGNKLMAICPRCNKLVRVDKPLIGSIHLCA